MAGTVRIFGQRTITVEHSGADTTTLIDPESVAVTEAVKIERWFIRLDGAAGATLKDTAGNVVDKLYAGAFGVEGDGNADVLLPLGFGLVFESDGAAFASVTYQVS